MYNQRSPHSLGPSMKNSSQTNRFSDYSPMQNVNMGKYNFDYAANQSANPNMSINMSSSLSANEQIQMLND